MNRGDRVADFELPDQTGTMRTLSGLLADGPIVLFFYPAAMTPGCTKEACHFRDLAGKAAELRSAMIEAAVELDDAAMEAYLEGNEPDEATLRAALARWTKRDIRAKVG